MRQNGGPAFPYEGMTPMTRTDGVQTLVTVTSSGMSLRDYFAAAALPCFALTIAPDNRIDDSALIARHVYEMADAMLKARESVSHPDNAVSK